MKFESEARRNFMYEDANVQHINSCYQRRNIERGAVRKLIDEKFSRENRSTLVTSDMIFR